MIRFKVTVDSARTAEFIHDQELPMPLSELQSMLKTKIQPNMTMSLSYLGVDGVHPIRVEDDLDRAFRDAHACGTDTVELFVGLKEDCCVITLGPELELDAAVVTQEFWFVSDPQVLQSKWTLQNTGRSSWPLGSYLHHLGGSLQRASRQAVVFLPPLQPGDMTATTVELQKGHGAAFFRCCTGEGIPFGEMLTVGGLEDEQHEQDEEKEIKKESNWCACCEGLGNVIQRWVADVGRRVKTI